MLEAELGLCMPREVSASFHYLPDDFLSQEAFLVLLYKEEEVYFGMLYRA